MVEVACEELAGPVMKGVARISFRDGAMLFPIRTPYEWELLFEHLGSYVRRHGRVGLEIDRQPWVVATSDPERSVRCSTCLGACQDLSLSIRGRYVYLRCGRREITASRGKRLPAIRNLSWLAKDRRTNHG